MHLRRIEGFTREHIPHNIHWNCAPGLFATNRFGLNNDQGVPYGINITEYPVHPR